MWDEVIDVELRCVAVKNVACRIAPTLPTPVTSVIPFATLGFVQHVQLRVRQDAEGAWFLTFDLGIVGPKWCATLARIVASQKVSRIDSLHPQIPIYFQFN